MSDVPIVPDASPLFLNRARRRKVLRDLRKQARDFAAVKAGKLLLVGTRIMTRAERAEQKRAAKARAKVRRRVGR